jgi:hypothetical protein
MRLSPEQLFCQAAREENMTALLSLGIQKYISEHQPQNIIFPLEKARKLAVKRKIKTMGPSNKIIEYGMDSEVLPGHVIFYTSDLPGVEVRIIVAEFKIAKIEIGWKVANIDSIINAGIVEYHPCFVNNIEADCSDKVLLNALHIQIIKVEIKEERIVGFAEPEWKKIEIAGFPYPIPKWYCFAREMQKWIDSLYTQTSHFKDSPSEPWNL